MIQYSLKKRQDIISNVLLGFVWPGQDIAWIEISLHSKEPIEMMICQKDNSKSTMNDMEHLKKFVVKVENKTLAETKLCVFAESDS